MIIEHPDEMRHFKIVHVINERVRELVVLLFIHNRVVTSPDVRAFQTKKVAQFMQRLHYNEKLYLTDSKLRRGVNAKVLSFIGVMDACQKAFFPVEDEKL